MFTSSHIWECIHVKCDMCLSEPLGNKARSNRGQTVSLLLESFQHSVQILFLYALWHSLTMVKWDCHHRQAVVEGTHQTTRLRSINTSSHCFAILPGSTCFPRRVTTETLHGPTLLNHVNHRGVPDNSSSSRQVFCWSFVPKSRNSSVGLYMLDVISILYTHHVEQNKWENDIPIGWLAESQAKGDLLVPSVWHTKACTSRRDTKPKKPWSLKTSRIMI